MRKRTVSRKPYSPTFKRDVAGIYYLLQGGHLVYIGQSGNIWGRIAEHISNGNILFDEWFYQEIRGGEYMRLVAEAQLIKNYRPPMNRRLPGRKRFDLQGINPKVWNGT